MSRVPYRVTGKTELSPHRRISKINPGTHITDLVSKTEKPAHEDPGAFGTRSRTNRHACDLTALQ